MTLGEIEIKKTAILLELIFPRMSRVRTTDQVLQMIKEAKER